MKNIVFYIAVLIGIFLVIVYFKGSTAVINSGSSAVGQLVLFLQGRDSSGKVANYPQ